MLETKKRGKGRPKNPNSAFQIERREREWISILEELVPESERDKLYRDKEDGIVAAIELGYGNDCVYDIIGAKTCVEIDRILKSHRNQNAS